MGTYHLLEGNLRSRNISEVLIGRITDSILSGELKPGDKLPTEEMFAQRIGVGRNSVHEAMKILEAFGVVEVRRADGTYVSERFRGSMIHPMLYGVVLSSRHQGDTAEFKVRVQEMIVMKIMELECERGLEDFRIKANRYSPAKNGTVTEQVQYLEGLELCLLSLVNNPMLQELYRMTIPIGNHVQTKAVERKFETGNPLWFPEFFREMAEVLIRRDGKKLRHLMKEEHKALLCGVKLSI